MEVDGDAIVCRLDGALEVQYSREAIESSGVLDKLKGIKQLVEAENKKYPEAQDYDRLKWSANKNSKSGVVLAVSVIAIYLLFQLIMKIAASRIG